MRTFAQKPKGTQQTTSAQSTKPSRSLLGQSPDVRSILQLQRTIGNQASQRSLQAEPNDLEASSASKMSRGLAHDFSQIPVHDASSRRRVQFELKISEPGDQYEQEADRVADQVMRAQDASAGGRASAPDISRLPAISPAMQPQTENAEVEEMLQTKPLMRVAENGAAAATPQLASQLNSSKGGGQPLPKGTLSSMNNVFGKDFSGVRVHTGSRAQEMSQGIQAKAFTHGSDIYFNRGLHNPGSTEGKRLLAHELTHVLQQGGGDIRPKTTSSYQQSSCANPQDRTSDEILYLQRTIGNAAVSQLISSSIQREDASDKTPTKDYELNKFVRNKADLTEEHTKALQKYAEQIKQMLEANPEANITIVGHGDATGGNEVNKTIGLRRAQTVKEALIKLGVPETRIAEIRSDGEENLAVPTEDGIDNALNRRVQILTNGIRNSAPVESVPQQENGKDVKPPAEENKPKDAKPEKPSAEESKPENSKPDKDPKDGKKSYANTLQFVPSGLFVPWKTELITGKSKRQLEGSLSIDYLYFDPLKFGATKDLKIFFPASLKYAFAGNYKIKDQKWELVHSTGLTVGVSVKWSPFGDDIPLYLKGFGSTGLRTDFSEGYWSSEGKASLHYSPLTWLDIGLGAKISSDVPLGANPDSKTAIDATPIFLQLSFPLPHIPLGGGKD